MNTFAILGAKYLILLSPLVLSWYLYRSGREIQNKVFLLGAFSLPLSYLGGLLARALYFDPRPFVEGQFEPLIKHVADNGFPSDHTLLLAAIASVITFYDKRYATILWVITLVVGLSRVYAGVHHLLDIAGAILIALVSTSLVYFVLMRIKKL